MESILSELSLWGSKNFNQLWHLKINILEYSEIPTQFGGRIGFYTKCVIICSFGAVWGNIKIRIFFFFHKWFLLDMGLFMLLPVTILIAFNTTIHANGFSTLGIICLLIWLSSENFSFDSFQLHVSF